MKRKADAASDEQPDGANDEKRLRGKPASAELVEAAGDQHTGQSGENGGKRGTGCAGTHDSIGTGEGLATPEPDSDHSEYDPLDDDDADGGPRDPTFRKLQLHKRAAQLDDALSRDEKAPRMPKTSGHTWAHTYTAFVLAQAQTEEHHPNSCRCVRHLSSSLYMRVLIAC